jgi:hypothetical protein
MPSTGFWRSKPPAGSTLDRAHPLAQGLVGCWLLNEGAGGAVTNLADGRLSSPAVGGPTWGGLAEGPALVLNGTSQYVPLGDYDLDYITIVARVRAGSGGLGVLVNKNYDGVNVPYGFGTRFTGSQINEGMTYYDGSWHGSGLATNIDGDGREHVVGGTFDGVNLRYWLDGVVNSSNTVSATVLPKNDNPADLGTYRANGHYYEGSVAWLLIYQRALSAAEMQALATDTYQLFAPPVWRRYFIVSEAPPPPTTRRTLPLLGVS